MAPGSALNAIAGTWASGVTFTYKWSLNGAPIAGADSASYVIQPSDGGGKLTVAVTGSKPGFVSVTKSSTPSATVPLSAFSSTSTAIMYTGQIQSGTLLSASLGWDPGTTFTYQWIRGSNGGSDIPGATSSTYTATTADEGQFVRLAVTGVKQGFNSIRVISAPQKVLLSFARTSAPILSSATPRYFDTISATTGVWDTGVTFEQNWACLTLGGKLRTIANGPSMTLGDPGYGLDGLQACSSGYFALLTGSKVGYASVSLTTSFTPGLGSFGSQPEPVMGSSFTSGASISVLTGLTVPAGTSVYYTWYLDGRQYGGSGRGINLPSLSYTRDGHTIRVSVRLVHPLCSDLTLSSQLVTFMKS